MRFNEHISLQGKFKFDVYKADGSLNYSTDYIKNFITSTGLSYPSLFAFADCFRYLSVGSGSGSNTLLGNNGWGTTGLQSGISDYSYIGALDCAANSSYETEACGFREQSNQLVLSRAWRVPKGTGTFDKPYTFREFMVSPGRPPVDIGGIDYCGCDEGGLDGSALTRFYTTSVCSGKSAFARVLKSLPVLTDDFLVVTYDLSLTYNTGIKNFAVTAVNSVGGSNWTGVISGRANLIHHGTKVIYDNLLSSSRIQDFTSEYGESYIAPWGCPIEPTCPETKLVAYLSTDNIQFLVNKESGANMDTGAYQPYNPLGRTDYSTGLMSWRSEPAREVSNGFSSRLLNIRTQPNENFYPDNSDASSAVSANDVGFDVKYQTHSRIQHSTNFDGLVPSGRQRTSEYSCQFWGQHAGNFLNQPVRSLVLAYRDNPSSTTWIPFYDIIFATRNETYTNFVTGNPPTYTVPSDSSPPNDYFYSQDGGDLTMSFLMSWSSPCESGVIGC